MNALRSWALPTYLLACLLLGGASAAGLWANVLLQVLAIPLLVWALASRHAAKMSQPEKQLLGLAAALFLLGFVQLLPLPPEVWSALPGRDAARAGFELLGEALPWLPLSLSPYATIASLLWLLPAAAVLLWLVRFKIDNPARLAWTIVGVTALSVLIGALQISGGMNSAWYFYRITNYGVMVGFFANANHMATLLVVTL